MTDLLLTALSSVAFVTLVLGSIVLIARRTLLKLIEKWVDVKADLTLRKYEINLNNLKIFNQHALDAATTLPKLILELRNACRQLCEKENITENDATPIRVAVEELEARLTDYFVLLPKTTFQAIHDCKEAGRQFHRTIAYKDSVRLRQTYDNLEFKRELALAQIREWCLSTGLALMH